VAIGWTVVIRFPDGSEILFPIIVSRPALRFS